MHSSGDTYVACLVSVCELAWLLMCALLVTQMWPVFVSDGRLAWFLMCTLVITQTWPVFVSEGELA